MKLFDHLLLRIANLPYELLKSTDLDLSPSLEKLIQDEKYLITFKDEASKLLLTINQSIEEKKTQQDIQNIRRKIFQLKHLNQQEIINLSQLPVTAQHIINEYLDNLLKIEKLHKYCRESYEGIVLSERKNIQQISHSEILLKGVALSSHVLYHDILKYQSTDASLFRSDDLNTEKSVLKYLSRIITKTTPFSTFTGVTAFSYRKMDAFYSIETLLPSNILSSYKINAFLLHLLTTNILSDKELCQHLKIHINATIQKKKKGLTFIKFENGRHDFKTVETNAVLKKILAFIKSNPSTTITILASHLSREIDEDMDTIINYLFQLLDLGIIEIDFKIDLCDPDWISNLQQNLIETKDLLSPDSKSKERLKHLSDLLSDIREVLSTFPFADGGSRVKILQELQKKVEDFIKSPGIQSEKSSSFSKNIRAERLLFEDSSAAYKICISKSYIYSVSSKLSRLFNSLPISNIKRKPERKAYEFYNSKYPDKNNIPLLEFYENYFKEILQPEFETKNEDRTSFFSSQADIYKRLQEEDIPLQRWSELFLKAIEPQKGLPQINLNLSYIETINKTINLTPSKYKKTFGAFIQPCFPSTGSEINTIVNNLFGSYGKPFSRFLEITPQKVKTALGKYIKSELTETDILTELNDPSFHNANIHPNILPNELKIPGARFSHPEHKQINLSQCLLRRDEANKRLTIYDKKTNKRIIPIDFGFQTTKNRIELFQFIYSLSPIHLTGSDLILEIINHSMMYKVETSTNDYFIKPRVVIEDNIVLQRMTWVIASSHIPTKESSEDSFGYFKKLKRWIAELNLPNQVFIKRGRAGLKDGKDDYKPQYIDFNSPLFVSLFEKNVRKNNNSDLIIAEAAPANNNAISINNCHFAAEFFLQATC